MTLAYLVVTGVLLALSASAQERVTYQMPPQAIADIADAPPTPGVVLDPTKQWLVVLERKSLGSIDELAQTEYRLAGLRIHPATNARSRRSLATRMTLVSVALAGPPFVKITTSLTKIRCMNWPWKAVLNSNELPRASTPTIRTGRVRHYRMK